MSSNDEILIEEIPACGNKRIGHITLNSPKTLNSLTLPMIEQLRSQLSAWEADDNLVCIFMQGSGDKAFCAGANITRIYQAMTGDADSSDADSFFLAEYRLDYFIHTMQTPIIAWGDGIVMGGGLGILAGASHRVVTQTSRLAMPEITIGLFPDVGATWFLNRMPASTGLFLGLTGAHMNAGDALFTGFANRFIDRDEKAAVIQALTAAENWQDPAVVVEHVLRQAANRSQAHCPHSHLRKHLDCIDDVCDAETLSGVVASIRSLESHADSWLAQAGKTHAGSCPVSAHLVYEQIRHGKHLSLKQCFMRELEMALACIRKPDFREGVRALLIDKDRRPQWRYASVAEVPATWVDEHFIDRWDGEHPLADLSEIPA